MAHLVVYTGPQFAVSATATCGVYGILKPKSYKNVSIVLYIELPFPNTVIYIQDAACFESDGYPKDETAISILH